MWTNKHFECNCDVNFLDLKGLSEFYVNVLRALPKFKNKGMPDDTKSTNPWLNFLEQKYDFEEKFIYYKDWHAVGIERVKDLLNS